MKQNYLSILFGLLFICSSCNYSNKKVNNKDVFTKYDNLVSLDGKIVTISGIFTKYNASPKMSLGYTLYLSGMLMEGDTIPLLFLEEPKLEEELDKLDGKKVEVTGIFHLTQPTRHGDPEYASKFRGSWIYNVDSIVVMQ